MQREKTTFCLYAVLDGMALLTLLLLIIKATPLRLRMIESGVTPAILACFVLIPSGAIVLWLLGRRRVTAPSRAQVVFYRLSKLCLVLAWIPSVALVAFWTSILLAASRRYDERTERHVFPSGDILYEETYVTRFRDTTRLHKFTLAYIVLGVSERVQVPAGPRVCVLQAANQQGCFQPL